MNKFKPIHEPIKGEYAKKLVESAGRMFERILQGKNKHKNETKGIHI